MSAPRESNPGATSGIGDDHPLLGESVPSVDLSVDKLLIVVVTESSTKYYIDSRGEGPRMMRARGVGPTHHSPYDNQWLPLRGVISYPPETDVDGLGQGRDGDYSHTLIRRGSRHQYYWSATTADPSQPLSSFRPRMSDHEWFLQRTASDIYVLDAL
ncbi:hypothetical protein [Demequina sp. NBRC 110055]|uniref:hypothetical protein n=1 Tax=Demequina sp. NBRC 110055 TaxID=1570344 RepID=UPI000A0627AD|nr:hypothetical protein [Demequina sp. NBRC 110055]